MGGKPQPEILAAVARFRELPKSVRQSKVLLYWLIGAQGTPPYKMPPAVAEYVDKGSGPQSCGNCGYLFVHVGTGSMVCSQIQGTVAQRGWCKLWSGT